MADNEGGGTVIDFELGVKKQLPEIVKEIFTPEQIEEYKQLFKLYDYENQGVINISMVPKILSKVQHEHKLLDLQMAMQQIEDHEIDEMIFLELAAKCYLQSWSKKQILKAFKVLNEPYEGITMHSSMLQYYMSEFGEPLDPKEMKLFMFLANPERDTGNVNYKEFIKKLGLLVPRESQKSRVREDVIVKAPKMSDVIKKLSFTNKKDSKTDIVDKSKSLDVLLKSIDMYSEKSISIGLKIEFGEEEEEEEEEEYLTISEIIEEE